MKLELTKRDIFLLKLASSILIIFLTFRFLIMPGISGYQEKMLEAETLSETKEEMEAAIESVPLLTQTIETRRQQLAEASAPYYARMENLQVDEILTGLAVKLGLFPVSLSIQNPKPGLPEPYLYAKSQDAVPGQDTTSPEPASSGQDAAAPIQEPSAASGQEISDTAAASGAVPETASYVLTGTGNITLRGTQEQMFLFVDELKQNYPAIRIRSMQMNQRVFLDSAWDVVEELETAFELDIYMHEEDTEE